jgi:hypothetical protein
MVFVSFIRLQAARTYLEEIGNIITAPVRYSRPGLSLERPPHLPRPRIDLAGPRTQRPALRQTGLPGPRDVRQKAAYHENTAGI